MSTITLPNGKQYKFYYGNDNPNGVTNPYGLLSEIDYPSGAWVRYTWKMSDILSQAAVFDSLCNTSACGGNVQYGCQYQYKTPVVATRQVGFGGSSTPQLTQSFTYSTTWSAGNGTGPVWTQKTTSVTSTDNVRVQNALTKYTYSGAFGGGGTNSPYDRVSIAPQIPVEIAVQYYSWGNTSTPIRTVNKTWFSIFDIKSEQTVLDNGASSKTTYCYVGSSCQPNFIISQLKEQDEYDFGQSAPFRKTVFNYQSLTTGFPTGTGGIIVDKPCQTLIYDGGDNRFSETDYFYDGGATGTVCGSAAGRHHGDRPRRRQYPR